jgi:hypothetical protein
MADLIVDLGFNVTPQSIRDVQSELTKKIEAVEPRITVGLAGNSFGEIRKAIDAAGLKALIDLIPSEGSLTFLQETLRRNLSVEFTPKIATFDARKSIRELKDEIDKELQRFLVSLDLERRRGGGGKSATQILPAATQESAEALGLSTQGSEVRAQRIKSEQRLIALYGKEAILVQKLTETDAANSRDILDRAYKRNAKEQQVSASAVRKNFEAIQKINNIVADWEGDIITASEALTKFARINIDERFLLAGQAADKLTLEVERAQRAMAETAKAEDLASDIVSRLNASRNRGLQDAKDAAAADKESLAEQKKLTAAGRRNVDALEKLAAIRRKRASEEIGPETALRQTRGVEGFREGQAGSAGELVKQQREALVRELEGEINSTARIKTTAETLIAAYDANRKAQESQTSAGVSNFNKIQQINDTLDKFGKSQIDATRAYDKIAAINFDKSALLASQGAERAGKALEFVAAEGAKLQSAETQAELALKELERRTKEQAAALAGADKSTQERLLASYEANRVSQEQQAAAGKSNFESIQKIREAGEQLSNAEITAADALKLLSKIDIDEDALLAGQAMRELGIGLRVVGAQAKELERGEVAAEAAALGLANELRETAAAEKRNRGRRIAALKTGVRAAQKNAKAIEALNRIEASLGVVGTDLIKARQKAADVGFQIVGADQGIGASVATAQNELLQTIDNQIAQLQELGQDTVVGSFSRKALAEAEENYNRELFQLQKEAEKNQKSLKRLASIEDLVANNLLGLSSAIKQAGAIEVLGDVGGAADLPRNLEQLKFQVLGRLQKQKSIADAEADTLQIVKDIDAETEKANKILARQNKARLQNLGITKGQLNASSNILKQLNKEANIIVEGQKNTQSAFEFAADAIRNGARKIAGRFSSSRPTGGAAPGGGGGRGRTVTFRNAADVSSFAEQLNPKQLTEFAQILGDVSRGAQGAQKRLESFRRTINEGSGNQDRFNGRLEDGTSAAQAFGRQLRIASTRLLAWAAPSALIFQTVSRLRQAVNEIVEIDKQARRLVFFQNSGAIVTQSANAIKQFAGNNNAVKDLGEAFSSTSVEIDKTIKATQALAVSTKDVSGQFRTIANISLEFGLALDTTTDALIEVARVGQAVTDSTGKAASSFAGAALSLIRVEGAALGASEAVRGLQAIQAQFFGGRAGAIFSQYTNKADQAAATGRAVANAAALLEVTSAGSSASVSELIDATTRLGSAFSQIVGLNFGQTVAVIGEAFTVTGATTGRLATALRQTATLIAQNAGEIKELTGIEVTNADGTIRDFEAILDVLERIRDKAGSLQAVELSLLIADRRNVADIVALAEGVDRLRGGFERFKDGAEAVNRAISASEALYRQTQTAIDSLEGRITKLRISFTKLVESEDTRKFLRDFVSGVTNIVDAIGPASSAIANFIGFFRPVALGLKALGFAFVIGQLAKFGKGIILSGRALGGLGTKVKEISKSLKANRNVADNLNEAFETGVFTQAEQAAIEKQQVKFGTQRLGIESRLNRIQKKIADTQGDTTKAILRRQSLRKTENRLITRAERLERKVADAARNTAKNFERASREADKRALKQWAALGASLLLAGQIEGAVRDAGRDGLADGISLGMSGAVLGSSFGPKGILAGALLGLVAGAIKAGVKKGLFDSGEELSKEAREGVREQGEEGGTSDLLIKTATNLRKIIALRDQLDGQGKKELRFERQRLQEIKRNLQFLENTQNVRKLDGEEQARLRAQVVQLGKAEENLANLRQKQQKRDTGRAIVRETNRLLLENKVLVQDIVDVNSSADNSDQFKQVTANVEAEKERLVLVEQRRLALEKITRDAARQEVLTAALSAAGSDFNTIELQVKLNEAEFNRTVAEAQARLDVLNKGAQTGENAEKILQEKAVQLEVIRKANIKRISDLIKARAESLSRANKETTEQIKLWETASQRVTKAFDDIVSKQKGLADIFAQVGELNANILSRTSSDLISGLDRSGASIARRLDAVFQASQARLRNLQEATGRQRGTLGGGFGSGADIARSIQSVIEASANVISKSDEAITKKRTNVVTQEAAISREAARIARANFQRRIGETKREIDIRRKLLQGEIDIFKERFEAEKQLNTLRREQLESFGRLLIESPQKFKEQLDSIGTAGNFFKGITDITAESLSLIQRRSEGLRQTGRGRGALQEVLQGIDAAVQTNAREIVAGVSNRELQQIFTRAQRENTADLAADIEKQREEARSQTQIQREIDARQKELIKLSEADAVVQNGLLSLAEADARAAAKQRDLTNTLINESIQTAVVVRDDIVSALNDVNRALDGERGPGEGASDLRKQVFAAARAAAPLLLFRKDQTGKRIAATQAEIKAVTDTLVEQFGVVAKEEADGVKRRQAIRDKLNEQVEAERRGRIEGTDEISKFTATMREARIATEDQIKATQKQTGAGLKDVGVTKVGQETANLVDQLRKQRVISGDVQTGSSGFSGLNKFVSDEIQQIKDRTKTGGQLTKVERERIRELERFSRRSFRNTPAGGRQLARRLFRDEGNQRRIVGQFRETLGDSAINKNEFIDRARRLRGEGARGRRGIDVEATQRFLSGAGFTGAARQISTRGQAANVLDRFIEISERLSKEQDKISNETKKKMIKVLGDELTLGIKDITNKTADLALLTAEESKKKKEALEAQREKDLQDFLLKATAGTVKAISAPETQNALKAAVVEGHQAGAEILGQVMDKQAQVLSETQIKVDDVTLTANIAGQINVAIDNDIGASIRAALLPVIGDNEQLKEVVENLKQALINANFPGIRRLPPNGGRVEP